MVRAITKRGWVRDDAGEKVVAWSAWDAILGIPNDLAHLTDIPKVDLNGTFLYQQIKPLLDWNDIQNKPKLYTQAEVDDKISAAVAAVLKENSDIQIHDAFVQKMGLWISSLPTTDYVNSQINNKLRNQDWQSLTLGNNASGNADAKVVNGIVELRGTVTIKGLSTVRLPTGCYVDDGRSFVVSNRDDFIKVYANGNNSLLFGLPGNYDLGSIMYPAVD